MVQVIILLLFTSLLSFYVYGDNNTITIQTQGTGTSITVQQVGSGNITGVYCGLGSFDNSLAGTHTCDGATISTTIDGISNAAYSQSVWSNHDGQSWVINIEGNDMFPSLD